MIREVKYFSEVTGIETSFKLPVDIYYVHFAFDLKDRTFSKKLDHQKRNVFLRYIKSKPEFYFHLNKRLAEQQCLES